MADGSRTSQTYGVIIREFYLIWCVPGIGVQLHREFIVEAYDILSSSDIQYKSNVFRP